MSYAEGRIRGISLSTFLQMVKHDRTTCTVTAHRGQDVGLLHFAEGLLVDAEAGVAQGTEAAYEIVTWGNPDLEIAYGDVAARPRRIRRPLMAILLDTQKQYDDAQRANRLPARAEGATEESIQPEEWQTNTLPQILSEFREEVPEFVSTDIVHVDSGLSISGGSVDPDFDSSVASACSAEVVKSNRRTLELLGLGAESTEDILISTTKVYMLIRMLGSDYYHVLAVHRRGNLASHERS